MIIDFLAQSLSLPQLENKFNPLSLAFLDGLIAVEFQFSTQSGNFGAQFIDGGLKITRLGTKRHNRGRRSSKTCRFSLPLGCFQDLLGKLP
jgi:hypothetical protein